MVSEIKKMSVKEFREKGYLQELNRKFLHPLGLAIEVVLLEDGEEAFGGVWDCRDDPEGIRYDYGNAEVTSQERLKTAYGKMLYVAEEEDKRLKIRYNALGYWVEPING